MNCEWSARNEAARQIDTHRSWVPPKAAGLKAAATEGQCLAEAEKRFFFVGLDVEDGEEARDLQQVVDALGEVQ
jgi:hypothetical protein